MRSQHNKEENRSLNSLQKIADHMQRSVINKIECASISLFSINIRRHNDNDQERWNSLVLSSRSQRETAKQRRHVGQLAKSASEDQPMNRAYAPVRKLDCRENPTASEKSSRRSSANHQRLLNR
jgi:hypothetical protein